LSLIEYDPAIHAAMQWVFGQTFICKDMETAKKITFHDRILKKSVTLDGDVFDPSGTLSGGKHFPMDGFHLLSAQYALFIRGTFMCLVSCSAEIHYLNVARHDITVYLYVCLY
jgi:structural maintenance of chromosome 2